MIRFSHFTLVSEFCYILQLHVYIENVCWLNPLSGKRLFSFWWSSDFQLCKHSLQEEERSINRSYEGRSQWWWTVPSRGVSIPLTKTSPRQCPPPWTITSQWLEFISKEHISKYQLHLHLHLHRYSRPHYTSQASRVTTWGGKDRGTWLGRIYSRVGKL